MPDTPTPLTPDELERLRYKIERWGTGRIGTADLDELLATVDAERTRAERAEQKAEMWVTGEERFPDHWMIHPCPRYDYSVCVHSDEFHRELPDLRKSLEAADARIAQWRERAEKAEAANSRGQEQLTALDDQLMEAANRAHFAERRLAEAVELLRQRPKVFGTGNESSWPMRVLRFLASLGGAEHG